MKNNFDISVIIPSYNCKEPIAGVIKSIDAGLNKYFSKYTAQIIIVDSSNDETTKIIKRAVGKVSTPVYLKFYRSRKGKGRQIIFGLSKALASKSRAVVMIDGDLRSIEPIWMKLFLEPILKDKYDFVAPKYSRDKYDSLITNHIAYPLVRSFLCCDLRQPIGGDFAFSYRFLKSYREKGKITGDIKEFGIDISLSFFAIANGFRISQVPLGAKDHGVTIKDPYFPEKSLGRMFEEVVGTLFDHIWIYRSYWSTDCQNIIEEIKGIPSGCPKPVEADFIKLWDTFIRLFPRVKNYQYILEKDIYDELLEMYEGKRSPNINLEMWISILTSFLDSYGKTQIYKQRNPLINSMIPLYFGRIACFVKEVESLSNPQVEKKIQNEISAYKKITRKIQ